jgi:hypothetical protein
MADGGFAPPAKDLVQSSELWNPITTPQPSSRQGLSLDDRGEIPNNAFPYVEPINLGDRFSPGLTQWYAYTEMIGVSAATQGDFFAWDNAGAGAGSAAATPETGHPGCIQTNTGTTTTGRAGYRLQIPSNFFFGNGSVTISYIIKTGTLSDGTNTYRIGCGFCNDVDQIGNNTAVASKYGVLFQYGSAISDGLANGNWRCTTFDGSSIDIQPTGVAVAASTWYLLTIEVNDVGNTVVYSINNNKVASTTTAIPTSSNGISAMGGIIKTAGTTSRAMLFDTIYLRGNITASRY